jgi:hypothetical protein
LLVETIKQQLAQVLENVAVTFFSSIVQLHDFSPPGPSSVCLNKFENKNQIFCCNLNNDRGYNSEK